MDVALLERLAVDWGAVGSAADLGCGTGRTGAWLAAHGVGEIDGVDLSPGMLAAARARGVYRSLREGEVGDTGLDGRRLRPRRLLPGRRAPRRPAAALRRGGAARAPGGRFVLVGFHPHFIIASGMPTHFDDAESGEPVAIETHVHLLSDHVAAGARRRPRPRRAARARRRRRVGRAEAEVGALPRPPGLLRLRLGAPARPDPL